tara:strand:+ start:126 stop:347 length:222 start_codon:yes stop_codon:yes gene_type:complete
MKEIISFFLKIVIILYQKIISPFFAPRCRYQPTCSNYSLKAIEKHGPWKGVKLSLKRIFSCHPWGGEGYDPIP